MNKLHTVMLVVLVMASGCATIAPTPRHRLALAADTYAATMQTLAELRAAGHISEEQASRIDTARLAARAALSAWREALRVGRPAHIYRERTGAALRALIAEETIAKEKRGEDDGHTD